MHGRDRRDPARAALGRGHAAVCKASAGAVEHLAIARVRNLADFLADAKAAGCWTYGAAAGARTPYRAVGLARRRRARARRGGQGTAPARRRPPATTSSRSRCAGRIESLNVSATAAVLLYEILQQRLDSST